MVSRVGSGKFDSNTARKTEILIKNLSHASSVIEDKEGFKITFENQADNKESVIYLLIKDYLSLDQLKRVRLAI